MHWRFFAAMGAHRPDVRRLMTKSWRFVARFSCSSGMIGLVSRTPTHGSLQGVSGLQFDVVCGVVSGRQSIPFESCGVAGFTVEKDRSRTVSFRQSCRLSIAHVENKAVFSLCHVRHFLSLMQHFYLQVVVPNHS